MFPAVSSSDSVVFPGCLSFSSPAPLTKLETMSAKLAELRELALNCHKCVLADKRSNVVFGVGNPHSGLMFIGEGPGEQEDIKGEPFVGKSGQLLDRLLAEEIGIGREKVYITNVVKCRPPGNRDPQKEEIEACLPYLEQQLSLILPKVIVTLGNPATKTILKTTVGITKMRGSTYEYHYGNKSRAVSCVVVPTFHPAAVLRNPQQMPLMRSDLVRAKQELLKYGNA